MNYSEFVRTIESRFTSRAEADRAIRAVFDVLASTITHGETVSIPDFGIFRVVGRAERNGINPRTGEKMRISAKKVVKLTTAAALKAKVNA